MSDAVLSVSEFGSLQQLRITVQQAPNDTAKDTYTSQVTLPHGDQICLHGPPTLHTHTHCCSAARQSANSVKEAA
eukprot:365307-Chlamydomonas_euryale.AAC.6